MILVIVYVTGEAILVHWTGEVEVLDAILVIFHVHQVVTGEVDTIVHVTTEVDAILDAILATGEVEAIHVQVMTGEVDAIVHVTGEVDVQVMTGEVDAIIHVTGVEVDDAILVIVQGQGQGLLRMKNERRRGKYLNLLFYPKIAKRL